MMESTKVVTIERAVAMFTPVFAALAGWLTTVAGKTVPGLTIPKQDLTVLFLAGATSATLAALHWLSGRQKFTQYVGDVERLAASVAAHVQASPGAPALADIEQALKAHEGVILAALEQRAGTSAAVDGLVGQLLAAAGHAAVPSAPVAPVPVAPPPAA